MNLIKSNLMWQKIEIWHKLLPSDCYIWESSEIKIIITAKYLLKANEFNLFFTIATSDTPCFLVNKPDICAVFIAIDITKERNIYFYPKPSAFVFANLPRLLANKFSGSPIANEFGP